jgi:hypothetical protein
MKSSGLTLCTQTNVLALTAPAPAVLRIHNICILWGKGETSATLSALDKDMLNSLRFDIAGHY